MPSGTRYVRPDWFTEHVFNSLVRVFVRLGVSLWGSRILEVRGRNTGEWRAVPVNLLTVAGVDYLVAPRGNTQWVRNLRSAGTGRLRLGRRVTVFDAVEVPDANKPAILRPYLKRWIWEVGQFFDGVGPDAPDAELLAIAPGYPVFRVSTS